MFRFNYYHVVNLHYYQWAKGTPSQISDLKKTKMSVKGGMKIVSNS